MTEEVKKLLTDSEYAIRALREYIQALPDEVVAQLPAMPGIDGDWIDVLQADLKSAIQAVPQSPVAVVKEGKFCNRLEWLSDDAMESVPIGSQLVVATKI